jgi:hypothetical protein
MEKAAEREWKRADFVRVLDECYTKIALDKRPEYQNYSSTELRTTLFLFAIAFLLQVEFLSA